MTARFESRRTARSGLAVLVLAVAAWLLTVGSASGYLRPDNGQPPMFHGYGVSIQTFFDADGNPGVGANFVPDGSLATASWQICQPGSQCRPQATSGFSLEPGPEPSGTKFIATATYRGRSYSATVTWHGAVHALTSPKLSGSHRVGSVVSPVAASWNGGWGDETDQLGVEACAHADGTGCRMLGGGELGCPDRSSQPTLGGWFSGWYLFAVDARLPQDQACAGTGYSTNADLPVWKLGPTIVRSGSLGRIQGPPRPVVKLLRELLVRGQTVTVGSVACATSCRVVTELFSTRPGSSGSSGTQTLTGHAAIKVPLRSMSAGPITVLVHVDDGPGIAQKARIS